MVLKNQKISKRDNVDMNEEDKISNLPDSLVHHIYSFLPTKCVLSTCILSKRWKYLSNSAPILDFDIWQSLPDKDYALDAQKMMNFLDMVLFVHEKPKIQNFILSVGECFDESRVNRWIGTVITRKVEELVLSIPYEKPYILPLSFFTCNSLVTLDLEYSGLLNLPNRISFPRLKILRLAYIKFVNENLTRELLSNCPILEQLSLVDCQFQNFKVLNVTSLTLKHLSIIDAALVVSTLKIFAPNLLNINYRAETPADFVLDCFPSLVKAEIEVYSNPDDERISLPLVELFKKLSNVKLLKMSGSSYRGVRSNLEDDNWTVDSLPQYSLSKLKSFEIQNFIGCNVELELVEFFLANARVLQMMTITSSQNLTRNYRRQMGIASKLLKFPRSSTSCVLEFLTPE